MNRLLLWTTLYIEKEQQTLSKRKTKAIERQPQLYN